MIGSSKEVVNTWQHLFDKHGVDEAAQQALVDFSEEGDDQWEYANEILSKPQAYSAGYHNNASAFVYRAITNARTEQGLLHSPR